jgi:hypothetical protein
MSSFYKNRTGRQNRSFLWDWCQWEEKGCGERVNIVQILYIHVCRLKNENSQNYFRNGVRGVKENGGGCKFMYYIYDIL